jgi:hypothetical protein
MCVPPGHSALEKEQIISRLKMRVVGSICIMLGLIAVLATAIGDKIIAGAGEPVHAGDVVCVTGASGYLGMELVAQLLERKYKVRGTVRDVNNAARVAPLKALPGADDLLELMSADLLVEGAFDDCVEGARYVFHTASPFVINGVTDAVKELIEPALHGTENVLLSVSRMVIHKHA